MIFSRDASTRALAGLPLHMLRSTGELQSSFGAVTPTVDRQVALLNLRRIASHNQSETWAAWRGRYRIELWPNGGRAPRQVITRSLSQFTPVSLEASRDGLQYSCSPDGKAFVMKFSPHALISGLARDDRGLLWVSYLEPTDAWQRPLPGECRKGPAREIMSTLGPDQRNALFRSVVDVIDPESGQLIATQTFPGARHKVLRHDLLVSATEDADGVISFQVWKLELTGFRTQNERPDRNGSD